MMNKYLVRYNKSRGQLGRGTLEHVWRVFENGKEFLCKHIKIEVPVHDERTGEDWSLCGYGYMEINKEESLIIIKDTKE